MYGTASELRATSVFFIKYLRTLGFSATNNVFAENAWYFRNALVRVNYTNLQKGIHETTEYLEVFLRNYNTSAYYEPSYVIARAHQFETKII